MWRDTQRHEEWENQRIDEQRKRKQIRITGSQSASSAERRPAALKSILRPSCLLSLRKRAQTAPLNPGRHCHLHHWRWSSHIARVFLDEHTRRKDVLKSTHCTCQMTACQTRYSAPGRTVTQHAQTLAKVLCVTFLNCLYSLHTNLWFSIWNKSSPALQYQCVYCGYFGKTDHIRSNGSLFCAKSSSPSNSISSKVLMNTNEYIYTHTHVCTYVYICTDTEYTWKHVHLYICMTYVCVSIIIFVCILCTFKCVCICKCICTFIFICL